MERQDKSRISAELEAERDKCIILETRVLDLTAKFDSLDAEHARKVEEMRTNYQKLIVQKLDEQLEELTLSIREEERSRMMKDKNAEMAKEKEKLKLSIMKQRSLDNQDAGRSNTSLLTSEEVFFIHLSLDLSINSDTGAQNSHLDA